MNEETDKNIADNSQNSPQEPVLIQDKKEISWFPVITIVTIAIICMAMYLIFSNKDEINSPVIAVSNSNIEEQPLQASSGSPVDHATYLQISDPSVIENSLRLFDIDGDGDLDMLGFSKLPSSSDESNYHFNTWYRNGTEFVYYPEGNDGFRLSEKYEIGLPCSIADLAIGSITLACTKSGQEYLTTLRYKKNGEGYYRDVDASAVTFSDNSSWLQYISKKGGIQFNYPSDLEISEKTYQIDDDLITVITSKRNGQTIFEIKTVPGQSNYGESTIDPGQKLVFLKLFDGSYLSRNWTGGDDSQEGGVFYERADDKENSEGSIFQSNSLTNVNKNRSYVLFTSLTSENNLKEVDNTFASIKYLEVSATKDTETMVPQNNPVSLSDIVTLQVPGQIVELQSTEKNPKAIVAKDLEITFIDSLIYNPAFLKLEVLPFGSAEVADTFGGGGYDLNKNGCYSHEKDVVTTPEKIGANQVCRFVSGAEGFSSHGYYILDPNQKYILRMTQYGNESKEILYPDSEAIVESVKFTN